VHNQICFTVDGQEICIPIPVLLAIKPIPIPDPDPGPIRELIDHWVEVSGPTPDPWKADLPIIATVAALAELSEDRALSDALTDVTRFYADKIADRLPEGARIEIQEVVTAKR
jgi:hypothetical protein